MTTWPPTGLQQRWPKQPSDFPDDGELFAILTPRSISIPGDERSRTNPGHGYPAHTEQTWDIELLPKDTWEKEIAKLTERRATFKAVRMTPAKISTHVVVE